MPKISIRKVGLDDVPALIAMMRTLAELEGTGPLVRTDAAILARDGFGERPHFGAVLAEIDGAAAGYVSYTVNYSIWAGNQYLHVDDVFVAEPFRQAGVGTLLMQAIAKEATTHGLAFVRWTVETDNVRAIAFYQKLGATVWPKGLCTWKPEQMTRVLAPLGPHG
ncbi:GNAT family N-acetyltransferase [Oxalobacteraceae bacterium OM1]|nr:GNAT family N-acetyltransferase [Oxalobacteraceae bacterium OM1]